MEKEPKEKTNTSPLECRVVDKSAMHKVRKNVGGSIHGTTSKLGPIVAEEAPLEDQIRRDGALNIDTAP